MSAGDYLGPGRAKSLLRGKGKVRGGGIREGWVRIPQWLKTLVEEEPQQLADLPPP
jgi:hypothetical protein